MDIKRDDSEIIVEIENEKSIKSDSVEANLLFEILLVLKEMSDRKPVSSINKSLYG